MKKRMILLLATCVLSMLVFVGCMGAPVDNSIKAITGTVTVETESKLTITAPDGTVYNFSIDQNTTTIGGNTVKGEKVQVKYSGSIIKDALATTIIVEKASTPEKTDNGGTVVGEVQDESMNNISIAVKDGEVYTFTKADDTEYDGGSSGVGDSVQILYTGDLKTNPAAVCVTVTKVAKANKENATSSDPAKEEGGVLSGVVIDESMNNITIKTARGNNYIFTKEDTTKREGGSSVTGNTVQITYTGDVYGTPKAAIIKIVNSETPTN